MINNGMSFIDVMTYLDHRSPSMTLSYAQIYDETLKNTSNLTRVNKSDSAKDAQIARLKERINGLEQQVQGLQEENELLYGKLINQNAPLTERRG